MQLLKIMAASMLVVLALAGCGGAGGSGGGASLDTVKPTVSIAALANSVSASSRTVSVNAADAMGVTKVELWADGVLIGTDTAGPYTFNWDISSLVKGSSHTLTAKAYDAAGNIGTDSVAVSLPISVVMTTVITGNTALGTVVLSGLTAPDVFGLNLTVAMPNGAGIASGTPAGIADPTHANAAFFILSETTVFLGGASGFGSGEVVQIQFNNVPAGAKPGDFSISLSAVLGSGFVPIQ